MPDGKLDFAAFYDEFLLVCPPNRGNPKSPIATQNEKPSSLSIGGIFLLSLAKTATFR
jgi:hypothetical protein